MSGQGNRGQVRGKHDKGHGGPMGSGDTSMGTDTSTGPTTSPGGTVGDSGREGRGRSDQSPGHLKKAAGSGTARDFAPGHGGTPPGQVGRGDAIGPSSQDEGEPVA